MTTGESRQHDSAEAHVSGRAVYVDDIPLRRDELHVAIGGATIASGRIESVDLSDVWRSPGVVDVLTVDELPHAVDIAPVFDGDPLLTGTAIEFHGQAIFAVAALTHQQARQAVLKARIEYEKSEPILDVALAVERDRHVRPPYRMQRGDADAALQGAPNRVRGELHVGGQEHFYLEGQVARAEPDEQGGVLLQSSNQNPTEAQHLVARVLGVPMHRVTVVTRRMGGGFGGKETQATACCALAALFAQRQGCAVRCRLSRRDDMLMTGKRHPFLNRYDVGFDDDGRILGARYWLAGQCGNSADLSDAIVDRAMFHCDNAYYLPAVVIDGLRTQSNTVSNTAFRGFGGPQGMLVAEVVIDEIAHALGLDPLVVRERNLYGTTDRNLTPYHQTVTSFTVPAILDTLKASSDYVARRASVREFNANNAVLRKGIAITPVKFGISFTVKHLNQGGALLHLYSDGSAQINHGGTEMGQGLMTKVQQIVAAELGMEPSRLAVMATRTDKVPNTSATAASSGTDINGMAALDAARTLKARLVGFLIEQHDSSVDDVEFANDHIRVWSAGERADGADPVMSYGWPELADTSYRARVQLSAAGFYKTPKIHYDRESASGRPFYYYANGAAVSEVLIDTLTGETRVLRTDILHDVGRSINPAIDTGQIEGGYVQGVGWLTHEELRWNADGRLLTDGPATYKIPAISDAPEHFNVALLQNSPNEEATVFRSKAVGEPPLMLAISVFAAIRDAVASVADHRVFPPLNAPATPEEILRVVDAVRAADAAGQEFDR